MVRCNDSLMGDSHDGLPPDLIPFIRTPLARPFHISRNIGMLASGVLSLAIFLTSIWLAINSAISAGFALLLLAVNASMVWWRFQNHAMTPLAVNLNHPFMDTEPMGKAVVMIRMSDKSWKDAGAHRLRLVADELLGGFNIVQDTTDFPLIGHFSNAATRNASLARHVTLINQAIALRDAVNDVPDPIESARAREQVDSGLLERSWLEDEGQIDVESPLVSFFKRQD